MAWVYIPFYKDEAESFGIWHWMGWGIFMIMDKNSLWSTVRLLILIHLDMSREVYMCVPAAMYIYILSYMCLCMRMYIWTFLPMFPFSYYQSSFLICWCLIHSCVHFHSLKWVVAIMYIQFFTMLSVFSLHQKREVPD